jgi:hypothetical protein
MFYQFFSHIKFLLESTNQHGVHSPFVFNFVTKGLYKNNLKNTILDQFSEFKTLSKIEQKVFLKIVNYFNIVTIHFDLKLLNKNSIKEYNLLYINLLNDKNLSKLISINSKFFIIIRGIHNHKSSFKKWQKIIKNKEATVTIDLFYFGLIFFRKEQAKEHFKIRA